MRHLVVAVPSEREADVLECLQGDACELRNVTRANDGVIATIYANIHRNVRPGWARGPPANGAPYACVVYDMHADGGIGLRALVR